MPLLPSSSFCTDALIQHRYIEIINNYSYGNFFLNIYRHCLNKQKQLRLLSLFLTAASFKKDIDILSFKTDLLFIHNNNYLYKSPRLANICIKHGILTTPSHLEIRSSNLFENLTKNKFPSLDGFLKQRLRRDADIAVVGNAPICKQNNNQSKGDEIDNCDIVIRFNKFSTQGFEKDIGSKTDIIARITNLEEKPQKNCPILLADDPLHHMIDKCFFINQIDLSNIIHFSAADDFDFSYCFYMIPSSGFKVLYSLYKQGFRNIKVFGFSFGNKFSQRDKFEHYFENVHKKEHLHNIQKESEMLSMMFDNS